MEDSSGARDHSQVTWEDSPPPTAAWGISLGVWAIAGSVMGLVVAYDFREGRPALPSVQLIGAMLVWGTLGVVTAVHGVRVFFRTIGGRRKVGFLALAVCAIAIQVIPIAVGMAMGR